MKKVPTLDRATLIRIGYGLKSLLDAQPAPRNTQHEALLAKLDE